MKALVIGAAGQVGSLLSAACAARGMEVTGAGIGGEALRLDLSDYEQSRDTVAKLRPDLVFLCSAMTYVDGCEKDPMLARRINAMGPSAVAEGCRGTGAKLVYLSTEYVFDGIAGPYGEEDPVNPLSVYGRTKLEGETACLALPGALSARTTVVYSYNPATKNFIMQLIENCRAGRKMIVPRDQVSNPTYGPDLAAALLDLAAQGASGVYNVTGPDRVDRYAFALRACELLGFDRSLMDPRLTSELNQPAPRPLQAGMKIGKVVKALGRNMMSVDEGLRAVAALMKNDQRPA